MDEIIKNAAIKRADATLQKDLSCSNALSLEAMDAHSQYNINIACYIDDLTNKLQKLNYCNFKERKQIMQSVINDYQIHEEEYSKWLSDEIAKLKNFIKNTNEKCLLKKYELTAPITERTKLKDMAFIVKEQIIEAQKQKDVVVQNCKRNSSDDFVIKYLAYELYRKNLALVALQYENLMSKQNRLQCFSGDKYYHNRKSIIKSMIADDGIDPNEIYWGVDIFDNDHYYNPLDDSITFDDINFTDYLFTHGALPRYQDLCETNSMYKKVCSNNILKNLFLKHKIMFYTTNDFGDIIPHRGWGNITVEDLTECLLNLIKAFKVKKDETLFTMSVCHRFGLNKTAEDTIQAIRNAGFIVSHLSHEITRLIYKDKMPQLKSISLC
jgi:hypothetical protein